MRSSVDGSGPTPEIPDSGAETGLSGGDTDVVSGAKMDIPATDNTTAPERIFSITGVFEGREYFSRSSELSIFPLAPVSCAAGGISLLRGGFGGASCSGFASDLTFSLLSKGVALGAEYIDGFSVQVLRVRIA